MACSVMSQTHTYALLPVPPAFHAFVKAALLKAGYDHAIDGEVIDMHGIALTPGDVPEQKCLIVVDSRRDRKAVERVFPGWMVTTPFTALTGHRFDRIVYAVSPPEYALERTRLHQWVNECLRLRLRPGAEIEVLCD